MTSPPTKSGDAGRGGLPSATPHTQVLQTSVFSFGKFSAHSEIVKSLSALKHWRSGHSRNNGTQTFIVFRALRLSLCFEHSDFQHSLSTQTFNTLRTLRLPTPSEHSDFHCFSSTRTFIIFRALRLSTPPEHSDFHCFWSTQTFTVFRALILSTFPERSDFHHLPVKV